MSSIIETLVTKNPLLAHGLRTHSTGIALPAAATASVRRPSARRDVDAPKIHLGHAGR